MISESLVLPAYDTEDILCCDVGFTLTKFPVVFSSERIFSGNTVLKLEGAWKEVHLDLDRNLDVDITDNNCPAEPKQQW